MSAAPALPPDAAPPPDAPTTPETTTTETTTTETTTTEITTTYEARRLFRPLPWPPRLGPTKQISTRLDAMLVERIDEFVAAGKADSRASFIDRAVRREVMARVYAHEAEILANDRHDPEMEAMAQWMVGRYPPVD